MEKGGIKMAKCPHCKQEITLNDVDRDTIGAGFLKQEIMYSCPYCNIVIGFSRGNYR